MASYSLKLILTFILAIATQCTHSKANDNYQHLKETKMTLFFQDWSGGQNATIKQLNPGAHNDGTLGFFEFGSLFVTDDPITAEVDGSSDVIARGQGLYVTSALDGTIAHVSVSIVFTAGEYSGSTLQIQGASPQLEEVREVAVVGGTGIFRYARGYATFETVHFDLHNHYVVIRFNATVQHYFTINPSSDGQTI